MIWNDDLDVGKVSPANQLIERGIDCEITIIAMLAVAKFVIFAYNNKR